MIFSDVKMGQKDKFILDVLPLEVWSLPKLSGTHLTHTEYPHPSNVICVLAKSEILCMNVFIITKFNLLNSL